ncbi:MAG: hypothetical protein VXA41_06995, partial [Euryarchaeota archaeon]
MDTSRFNQKIKPTHNQFVQDERLDCLVPASNSCGMKGCRCRFEIHLAAESKAAPAVPISLPKASPITDILPLDTTFYGPSTGL